MKEVINAAHDIGLFVRVCNRDVWKFVGIRSTRSELKNYIPLPVADALRKK